MKSAKFDVDELHEKAILLWIDAKKKDPDSNPAWAVFFALTGENWPENVVESDSAIQLCDVLNKHRGRPPLTEEEQRNLKAVALLFLTQHEAGKTPIHHFRYLRFANLLGYLSGLASILYAGFSWWVAGLMIAVWWCHGAARTAASMATQEPRPKWEVAVIAGLHLVALIVLFGVSLSRLAS